VNPDLLFYLMIAGLVVAGFTATGCRSLRGFSRHQLEEICRRRDALDRFGQILRFHERVALGIEHFVIAAVVLVVTTATWRVWTAYPNSGIPDATYLLGGVLVGTVTLAASVIWIPWTVTRLWAEPLLYHTWRVWRLGSQIAIPLVTCTRLVDGIFHRLAGRTAQVVDEESFEEEIRTIVTEGHREGLLEEDAREMIEGVIELGDADVSELMTPRTDMHMLHVDVSWEEMLEYVIAVGHTRIPVFRNNRDDVIGILYSKDLLPELAKSQTADRPPFAELLRKPYFVPETKAVDDLLEEFQQTRNHMAIVLDEYGGVSGLVTIEDVLEEIVGEIVDEYDDDLVEEIKRIDTGTCEALGRVHVDQINELMGIDLPEDDDFDTIGGFVFSELGHIPAPSESFVWHETVRVIVLEASRRRIERVRLERVDQKARESA